jgi:DNA repair protein RecN (Recombination protein N)
MEHYAKAKQELVDIENYDETIEQLRKEIDTMAKQVRAEANKLTALRLSAAKKLSKAIEQHLLSLGMPNAKFYIKLTPLPKFTAAGADDIVMMFSANLGETEKPIQKVASGGELSRIALAIKAVTAARDKIGVMVFDEIDTGIGGRTAQMVAERISLVAAYKQVLCITHLPQIACMADVHLYIDKQVQCGKTVTEVKRLGKGEQLNEIARMASGVDATVASLDNAMEMVDNAKLKKEKQRKAIM